MILKPKDSWWLLRAIGFFAALVGKRDMWDETWTTIGGVVYYPVDVVDPKDPCYLATREHEAVHCRQQEGWPWLLWLAVYALIPLPVGFAYFRWKWEREAYLVNIKKHGYRPEWCADTLQQYLWPWPKKRMLRWFERNR